MYAKETYYIVDESWYDHDYKCNRFKLGARVSKRYVPDHLMYGSDIAVVQGGTIICILTSYETCYADRANALCLVATPETKTKEKQNMITLKFRAYSNTELDTLYDTLENARLMVQAEAGDKCSICETCEYRHICNDLEASRLYTASEMHNRSATRR